MIVFAVGYADQLVTGALLGSTALGFYVLAFNLSSWPVSIFSQPLRSVAPAAFARLQDDPAQMNRAFADIFETAVGRGPAELSPAGWRCHRHYRVRVRPRLGAGCCRPWLSGVMAAARIFFELAYDFLVIKGESRWILFVQLGWLSVLVPALMIGAKFGGLPGVAIAQGTVALLVVLPAYALLLRRVGLGLGNLAHQVWPTLLIGIAVAGLALLITTKLSSALLACVLSGLVALIGVSGLLINNKQ